MNEETTKQLNEFLSKLNDGGDIILEQAPLFIQEIVTYGRGVHTAAFLAGIVLAFSTAAASTWFFKRSNEAGSRGNQDAGTGLGVAGIFSVIIGGAVSAVLTFSNFDAMVQVWLAPRLYVVEYLAKLVN